MKRKLYIVKVIAIICMAVVLSGSVYYAVDYSQADTISEAKQRKEELENRKKELKNELNDLESEKLGILQYIEKVDRKSAKLTGEMRELKAEVKEKKKAIKQLSKDIEISIVTINNQYETMKKRIKYMYEHGKTEYLDIILESGSLSDMLSRSEYIQKISEYDENMLVNYVNAKAELENQKAELEESKRVLDIAVEELKEEKKTLQAMIDKKNAELDRYKQMISQTQSDINENASEIEKQEKIIEDALIEQQRRIMEEERRKEEARKAEEAKKNQDSTSVDNAAPTATTAAPAGNKTGGFGWPLSVSGSITSYFGKRNSPTAGASSYHQGIDIGVAAGTPILAAKAGTVVTASYSSGAGNYVMINHGDGVFTVYMHASSLATQVGANVNKGDTIAYVGSTGVSTGNHLHFGISVGGVYVNPLNYVSQ